MLDVTYGYSRTPDLAKQLANARRSSGVEGSLYIGYPVFATAEEQVTLDALLVSAEHGLVIAKLLEEAPAKNDTAAWQRIKDDLDKLYLAVEASLSRYEELDPGAPSVSNHRRSPFSQYWMELRLFRMPP